MWRLFKAPRLFQGPASMLQQPKAVFRMSSPAPPTQRLRFSRRFKMRNLLVGGVVIYVSYNIYTTVVLSPLARWLEVEEQNMTPRERKALDEATKSAESFIPLPLTTRTVQPPPYSGNDPEWLEYVRISKNKPLQKQIRDSMAYKVRKAAEASIILTKRIGKDMKVRRHWLDIDYPYRPPVEYHRMGIFIKDDAIGIGERPVDPAIVNTIDRVLWPKPMFYSTLAYLTTMTRLTVQDFLGRFGYEPKSQPALPGIPGVPGASTVPASQHHPDIQKVLARIQQQATKRPEDVKDPRAMSEGSAAAGNHGPLPNEDKSKQDGEDLRKRFGLQPAGVEGEPWEAFKQKWKGMFKRKPEVPPRGCIAVSGLVEVETSKSFVVFDVIGWWNPKTKAYHDQSLQIRLRRAQLKQQKPFR